MGAFIPVNIEDHVQIPDYSEELELLEQEIENNCSLQLSQFCSSRGLSYPGFRSYLENNGITLRSLRMKALRKANAKQDADLLTGITIKLPSQVEVTIPSLLSSQLSNILKSL